jgi:hypothetical protein
MRPIRPWHVLLVCVALIVPIQAGALEGRGSALAVSASLGHCGVSGSGIMCRIDVSWSGVENATRYTATATLADGSVQDLGTVGGGGGGGSTAVWVPYAGSGTYTVAVTAWGSDPEGKDEKLEDDDAKAVIEDETADDHGKGGKDDSTAGDKLEQPEHQPAEKGDGEVDGQDEPGADPAPDSEEPPAEPQDDEAPPAPSPTPNEETEGGNEEPSKAPQETGAPGEAEQKAEVPEE